jgi:hypothetical protein
MSLKSNVTVPVGSPPPSIITASQETAAVPCTQICARRRGNPEPRKCRFPAGLSTRSQCPARVVQALARTDAAARAHQAERPVMPGTDGVPAHRDCHADRRSLNPRRAGPGPYTCDLVEHAVNDDRVVQNLRPAGTPALSGEFGWLHGAAHLRQPGERPGEGRRLCVLGAAADQRKNARSMRGPWVARGRAGRGAAPWYRTRSARGSARCPGSR